MTDEQLIAIITGQIASGMIANDKLYKFYGDNEILKQAKIWARTIAFDCDAIESDFGTWKETDKKS